jgi:hypothetical protein
MDSILVLVLVRVLLESDHALGYAMGNHLQGVEVGLGIVDHEPPWLEVGDLASLRKNCLWLSKELPSLQFTSVGKRRSASAVNPSLDNLQRGSNLNQHIRQRQRCNETVDFSRVPIRATPEQDMRELDGAFIHQDDLIGRNLMTAISDAQLTTTASPQAPTFTKRNTVAVDLLSSIAPTGRIMVKGRAGPMSWGGFQHKVGQSSWFEAARHVAAQQQFERWDGLNSLAAEHRADPPIQGRFPRSTASCELHQHSRHLLRRGDCIRGGIGRQDE